MTPKRLDLRDIRFEAKDAEIFRIPDTKTRLDTLQHYFFPRLEALLHDAVDFVQEVYGVNPYERMTITARPRHRKDARRSFDSGVVFMGLTGKRSTGRALMVQHRDGVPFSYHPSQLMYTVFPDGELQVEFYPFIYLVDAPFQATVADLVRDHCRALAPVLALYHVAQTCVADGIFIELSEAFSSKAITRATPSQRLALASPPYHFPLDAQMFPLLQGAFVVLYPLLEACTALAAGEPHHLMERMDAFQQWYRRMISQKADDTAAEGEPPASPSPEPVLPDVDSYTVIRAGLWWAVLARDRWTCCSCGRSAPQHGVLLEVDHIVPRSRGGTDALDNLQTLCKKCNLGTSNRDSTDLRSDRYSSITDPECSVS